MQLRLQEVDFTDGDELAAVQVAALADDELDRALHPGLSASESIAAARERWASVYGFASWHHKKVVDADVGKIVAYARWGIDDEYRKLLPPVTGIPEGMAIPPRQKPASLNFELAGQLGQQSGPIAERAINGRPSLFFDRLGVLPEYRRHGAAQLIFDWATAFADENDLICYSESDPENVAVHLENGFRKFDVIKLTDKDKTHTLEVLTREPKKHSA